MRFPIILLGAVALAGCSNSEEDGRAQFIAAGLNAITPKSLGDGLTMRGAVANGATLVLSIDGAAPSDLATPDFDVQLRKVVCADPGFRGAIDKGLAVTMDLTATDGHNIKVDVKSC